MPTIQNISDTASWIAMYRARETDRPDALFRDPFARKLLGDKEPQLAEAMKSQDRRAWSFVMRTVLYDQYIMQCIRDGADTVVNLAAGLDARPYRFDLPPDLRWIEIDLPSMIEYKETMFQGEHPNCRLERIALDLSNEVERRKVFERIGAQCKRAVVVTEGLLVYLGGEEVAGLAKDLASVPQFRSWVFNLVSPAVLRMMMKDVGSQLSEAGAPLRFAPEAGTDFFLPLGWKTVSTKSIFREAVKAGRTPFWLRIILLFPEPPGSRAKRIWSGVCLAERVVL